LEINMKTFSQYAALALIVAFTFFAPMMLSGCATLEDNLDLKPYNGHRDFTVLDEYGEGAFQLEHLADVVQTMHGAGTDPCFSEGDPTTKALIGSHPSQASIFAWGVGYGAVHYGITAWLLDHDHDRIAAVWEAASIIDTAAVVDHNYSIGVRIGAPNRDDAACLKYYGGKVPSVGGNLK
jgi:hypothetical protein